jgi:hypothetical protein
MLGSSSTSGYCSDLKWYDADGLCSPDRWDNLPEAALAQPGLFSNLLTFSAGPRVRASISIWVHFR